MVHNPSGGRDSQVENHLFRVNSTKTIAKAKFGKAIFKPKDAFLSLNM